MRTLTWTLSGGLLLAVTAVQSCTHKFGTDCEVTRSCLDDVTGGTGAGVGGNGEAGAPSGGSDNGTGGEAAACDPACSGATQVCDEDAGECVECTDEEHCFGALCDTQVNLCVECLDSSHCTDPSASRCEEGVCMGCTEASDCEGTGEPVCDEGSGVCVECVDESDCPADNGFNVCAPQTQTCTDIRARFKNVCGECTHDAECQIGQLCVETSYSNPVEGVIGTFCLWKRDAPLPGPNGSCGLNSQPFARSVLITSVDGVEARVCELATTTCVALLQHRTEVSHCEEAFTDDAACGAEGFNDGRCRLNSEDEPRCSYPCGGNEDCRAGFTCPPSGDQFCSL